MSKLIVVASDGSTHVYPEGHQLQSNGEHGWACVKDETGAVQAWFFRPVYAVWRDQA